MSREQIQRACWWVLVVTICAVLTVKTVLQRHYGEEDLLFLAWLAYVPVGAVVARRRPDNAIGWVFLLLGLCASVASLANVVILRAINEGFPYPPSAVLAGVSIEAIFFPLVMLSTTITFLLYPSGLLSPRWRPVLWMSYALIGFSLVSGVLRPSVWLDLPAGSATEQIELSNPISPEFVSHLLPPFTFPVFTALVVVCTLLSIWSAIRRARLSRGTERQQIQLFAFAIVFMLAVLLPAQYLAEHGRSLARFILLTLAFALVPISCGIAILRYRLYDIDRIIGRTTAYVLVTGVLLVVYGIVVTSVGRLLPEQSDSPAVAAATLAAAALFRPVLRWARHVVDRRFNREKFNAERAVEAFAARLRVEVETGQVQEDLLSVLDSTLQPSLAGIWLRGLVT